MEAEEEGGAFPLPPPPLPAATARERKEIERRERVNFVSGLTLTCVRRRGQ